jgi:hypothetical protein
MRFSQGRINVQCLSGVPANEWHAFLGRHQANSGERQEVVALTHVSQSEVWIERDGLLICRLGARHRFRREFELVMVSFQVRFVGGKIGCVAAWRGGLGSEGHLKRAGDGRRDLILHRKNVGQLAVVALRPEMAAVGGRDQLRGDADAAPGPPHAAFQDRRHSQSFGNLANVQLFTAKRKRRRPSNHLQPRNLRQSVDDLLGQPVAEIFLLLVAAHVGERQNRDRRRAIGGHRAKRFQRDPHLRDRLIPVRRLFRQASLHDLRCGRFERS